MAYREPDLFYALRGKQRGERSDWEYPFAAAGVNVTFMLVGALYFGLLTSLACNHDKSVCLELFFA